MDDVLPGIEERAYTKIEDGRRQPATHLMAIEEPLQVVVDGKPAAVLMRTPGREKELAVGFCISEGVIGRFGDIALVQHCGRSTATPDATADSLDISRNIVQIKLLASAGAQRDARMDVLRLVRSGCGRADPAEMIATMPPVNSGLRVAPALLAGLSQQVITYQETYRQSGGLHAVLLFDRRGKLVVIGEDIGRHNALDKALGHCILRGIPLDDKIIYSTGRASYEMVLKTVRAGAPILLSRSSATTLAIDLAEELHCTLIGYARGDKLSVYAHPERIVE